MPNLADFIEEYLKRMLEASGGGFIEIQRSDLADRFKCVPSQINYVINTRFSHARGYIVESRRGGGGFIRIVKSTVENPRELARLINETIGLRVDQHTAESLIKRLFEEGHISEREAKALMVAIHRAVLDLDEPYEGLIRAKLIKAMLLTLLSY